jgi:AraC-like DNA-binding protein
MGKLINLETSDVLTDVLATLRLRGRVFCTSELSAPWALSLPARDYAHFHLIERGGAWIRLKGVTQAVPLASGDLVIIAHGGGHILSDQPRTKAVPLEDLPKRPSFGTNLITHGGGGVETLMTCGSFQFETLTENPVLAALPPLIHLHGDRVPLTEWLEPTLKMLAWEARHPRPGTETVISRLTDIIFVQALRAYIEDQEPGDGGWLSALRDPKIGLALGLIHREPERDWTVAALAESVAMSRSLFAARFSALVDTPPLAYLTRWRMSLAARLLVRERLTAGEVARRVGYESEAAFSKAFKRRFGLPPSTYRRQSFQ